MDITSEQIAELSANNQMLVTFSDQLSSEADRLNDPQYAAEVLAQEAAKQNQVYHKRKTRQMGASRFSRDSLKKRRKSLRKNQKAILAELASRRKSRELEQQIEMDRKRRESKTIARNLRKNRQRRAGEEVVKPEFS